MMDTVDVVVRGYLDGTAAELESWLKDIIGDQDPSEFTLETRQGELLQKMGEGVELSSPEYRVDNHYRILKGEKVLSEKTITVFLRFEKG